LLPAYRNSPDIAKLASYFGNAYDGMNYLAQERQKPCLYVATDWEDEMDKLADVLRERRLLNHKCGIIVPTNRDLFSVTTKLKERGIEVHQAIAVRRGGTPPDFDSLTPIIASYHNAKGLTFDCVLLPKLVENNFQRVTGERRRRLLLVGITRATQWVYLSTVRGWELGDQDVFRQAAANGDLFIKETAAAAPVAAAHRPPMTLNAPNIPATTTTMPPLVPTTPKTRFLLRTKPSRPSLTRARKSANWRSSFSPAAWWSRPESLLPTKSSPKPKRRFSCASRYMKPPFRITAAMPARTSSCRSPAMRGIWSKSNPPPA
jgi:hypothetical protein